MRSFATHTCDHQNSKGDEWLAASVVSALGYLPPHLDLQPTERPDFVCSRYRLGVEVTTINGPDRHIDAYKEQLASGTEHTLRQAGARNLHAVLSFGSFSNTTKKNRRRSEALLTKAIMDATPVPEFGRTLLNNWDTSHPNLPFAVSRVRLYPHPTYAPAVVSISDHGFVTEDCGDLIQAALDAKEPLVAAYRTRCRRCNLVIAVDGSSPSTWFDPDVAARHRIYYSSFDRAFFVDVFARRCFELETRLFH